MNFKCNLPAWLYEFLQQRAAVDRIIAANLIEHLVCVRPCANRFPHVTSLNVLNNYKIGSSAGLKKSANSCDFSWSYTLVFSFPRVPTSSVTKYC